MAEPECPQKAPYQMELEAGNYFWCTCGKSTNQPFCDGAHQGSEFSPLKFTLDEAKKVFLCGCKQTGKSPFCDGAHNQL